MTVAPTPETAEMENEYARLYRLEQQRAKALAAISDAGREIATSPDLQRTLRLVINKAAETLPMDAGVLFLLEERSQRFEVAVSHNLTPERVSRIKFAFDEGVPGWVVAHCEPLIIDDATIDIRVHPAVVEEGVSSVLAVPLITRGRVIGVLNLFCQTGSHAFDDEALLLARVYADQTAVFIENARLMDELRHSAMELEARVEQRTRQLEEKQKQVIRAEKMAAVGRLAASVAHEVNNPLQAIALHLELIAGDGLEQAAQTSMALVQHELDRIAGIVQRLLEFQRPKHGRAQQQDLSALLQDVLTLSQKQLQRAQIAVFEQSPADMDPILAIGNQIEQVFLNLILNAIDAMPDGGDLSIVARQSNGHINISFTDNGTGMAPEVVDQLFEPFFSTKHSGSGLGLAVSHEIVTNHGGTLSASNLEGQGATFMVTLPVVGGFGAGSKKVG